MGSRHQKQSQLKFLFFSVAPAAAAAAAEVVRAAGTISRLVPTVYLSRAGQLARSA